MENKRKFTRVLFLIEASLTIADQRYDVSLHDISLNGALVAVNNKTEALLEQSGSLEFCLLEGSAKVSMDVSVVHEHENIVGLKCDSIDLDSVTHLRRLIELNMGDEEQLHKELVQLIRA